MSGKLITLEGIECTGKGVQSQRILEYCLDKHGSTTLTREPGGTPHGEALRAIIKHPEIAIKGMITTFKSHEDFLQGIDLTVGFERDPRCEMFMFLAARAEFVARIIRPALEAGEIVIADRFYDSTRAYQGGGRFFSDPEMIEQINSLNMIATENIKPNLTFLIDISVETMIRRMSLIEKGGHFEDTCNPDFFHRVRQEYLAIAEQEPDRVIVINGEPEIEIVWQQIKLHLEKM